MRLDIKTIRKSPCELIVQDNSPYLCEQEELEVFDKFKVSHRVGIDVIQQNKLSGTSISEYAVSEGIDPIKINIEFDGWGTLTHIVIPNGEWFEWQLSLGESSILDYYNTVYFSDGGKFYKFRDGNVTEIQLEELVEVNPEHTTISKYVEDFVSICLLVQCYLNLCKQLLESACLDVKCNTASSELIYKRDVIWMAINVIRYLVELHEYEEAERILETVGGCNGLCKNELSKGTRPGGCGCKAKA